MAIFALVVIVIPKFFYTTKGKLVYMIGFTLIPIGLLVNLIALEGYLRMYTSHLIALSFLFVFMTSLQAG